MLHSKSVLVKSKTFLNATVFKKL